MRPLAAALALSLMAMPAFAAGLRQQVNGWTAAHQTAIVAQLEELVRTPSVAANPQALAAAAAHLESLLKARGFATVQWADGGAPPLVFGSLTVPGAERTVVFYAHYDGQPVTPSQWRNDPFTPTLRESIAATAALDGKTLDPEYRLFGRAAADDKSSITAFLAGFDALKALGRKPSVNIKVVWEGEEEAGSAHLAATLKAHAGELASDLWLIGDGPVHQSRAPTLYFGARGSLSLEATVYGPIRALHDGHYGNWAPNPAAMAANLIAQMRDDDGRILIPGFYDDVTPLTAAEHDAMARLPPVEGDLKRQFEIGRAEGNDGLTASTMRPALNVRGLRSGQVGEDAANAIPVDAEISIDFRLVPGQTPAHVREEVERFLAAKGWTVVRAEPDAATRGAHPRLIRLAWGDGYPALRSDMTSPAAKATIAAATDAAGGPVVLLPMMGASVPITMFDAQFHVPVIGLPITNHDNNQHAANENLRLRNLWDAVGLYAAMMAELRW